MNHLTDHELTAYLERSHSSEERDAIESHLADCDACQAEVLALTRLFRKRRVRKRWYLGGPLAAAAAAAAVLVFSPSPERSEEPVLRDSNDGSLAVSLVAVSPNDGDSVAGNTITFTWRRNESIGQYRFTLTASDGAEVWSADIADTMLFLPDSVNLLPAASYFWYVDALLPDGRTATTGVRRFTVVP
jgi:predicted anti-sigma-YlaC factor YlaD